VASQGARAVPTAKVRPLVSWLEGLSYLLAFAVPLLISLTLTVQRPHSDAGLDPDAGAVVEHLDAFEMAADVHQDPVREGLGARRRGRWRGDPAPWS
jgi:hypothetical protein